MRSYLLFFFLSFSFPGYLLFAQPGNHQEMLDRAVRSYEEEDFTSAIEAYNALLKEGYRSHALYFNLGNCYYRESRIAESILAYERALLWKPGDPDITHNLELARNAIKDRITPVEPFFLKSWVSNFREMLSMQYWAVLSLIILWMLIAIVAYRLWYGRPLFDYSGTVGGMLLVLFCISAIFAYSSMRKMEKRDEAIVMVNAALYEAPSIKSEARQHISAGEKLLILDSLEMLIKVELPNTEQGWVDAAAVERI